MQELVKLLSDDLKAWGGQTLPIKKNDLVPVFRLDQSCAQHNLEGLFFETADLEDVSCTGKADIPLLRQQSVGTGRLRNSFYPEVFKQHSKIEKLQLTFDVTGPFSYDVHQSSVDYAPEPLTKGVVTAEGDAVQRQLVHAPFSLDNDIGKHVRLFWSLRSLSDATVLHDAAWQAVAPHDAQGRMVVVLRTFGRTNDIKNLLISFAEESRFSDHYKRLLKNVFFYVLDTSNGVGAEDYTEMADHDVLNVHVVRGANLGGGGNMSQALLFLEDALRQADLDVDELLLLDDDLRLSLESMLRHWASTVFRSDNTVFTVPVFMKSEPRKMWEDGALWGRFLSDDMSPDRTAIAPRLLRHNREFRDYEHLDEQARGHYPEYCTFIFFSLPYKRFGELGYPAAFFLRGDDIEYSLRHRKAGGRTLSNPNLCAWHEPAHSYGQEYMSIAHGTIINMQYGADTADNLGRFFYERLMSHISIGDVLGLKTYAAVLRDLNSKTMFLEHDFAGRYIKQLGVFKGFDQQFEYLSNELRDDLRRNAHDRNTFMGEYGFLYPPVEGNPRLSRVILENGHTSTYRIYDPKDPKVVAECTQAAAELTAELSKFLESYDDLRAHYVQRFEAVSAPAFWEKELGLHDAPVTLMSGNK